MYSLHIPWLGLIRVPPWLSIPNGVNIAEATISFRRRWSGKRGYCFLRMFLNGSTDRLGGFGRS